MKLELLASALMVLLPEIAVAQSDSVPEMKDQQLKEVTVTTRRAGTVKSRGVANAYLINSLELLKAACCNLGESFIEEELCLHLSHGAAFNGCGMSNNGIDIEFLEV